MIFTTITNGEGDAMRQLERKESGAAPKTPAKTDKAKKTSSMAQLVLANGDLGEAGRIGVALIGAGVTATTIGMLEGLARRGRAKWWSELSATQRSLIMITIVIVAGFIARHRRKGGHVKSAAALEAAAVAAWAMAVAYITEEGVTRFPVGSKDGGSTGALGLDELKALDKQIDDDIRNAARRLRELAETEREERARQAAANDTSEASEAMGLLSYHEGAADDDEDDDEDLF